MRGDTGVGERGSDLITRKKGMATYTQDTLTHARTHARTENTQIHKYTEHTHTHIQDTHTHAQNHAHLNVVVMYCACLDAS